MIKYFKIISQQLRANIGILPNLSLIALTCVILAGCGSAKHDEPPEPARFQGNSPQQMRLALQKCTGNVIDCLYELLGTPDYFKIDTTNSGKLVWRSEKRYQDRSLKEVSICILTVTLQEGAMTNTSFVGFCEDWPDF